jgi:hypothetical protein
MKSVVYIQQWHSRHTPGTLSVAFLPQWLIRHTKEKPYSPVNYRVIQCNVALSPPITPSVFATSMALSPTDLGPHLA